MKSKYLIFYVKACEPMVYFAETKAGAEAFVAQFNEYVIRIDNLDDNWIDLIVYGRVTEVFAKGAYPHLAPKEKRRS